jgi:hypothetical protein
MSANKLFRARDAGLESYFDQIATVIAMVVAIF